MTRLTNEIAAFCTAYDVSAPIAMMLPAVFDKGAEETGMPVLKLVSLATYGNMELGNYFVEVAQKCANSEAGKEAWAEFEEKMNG